MLVQPESRDGLDLLKREKDVAGDKVDAPKPKRRLNDINESDNDSDGESEMDELTRFRNFNISANEFLNCCNRYRNEPLGADKNSRRRSTRR